jgi:hypothetical protein
LAESNSKLLVVLPLKDERENESKKPPRSALMMECFDPSLKPEQLVARLEVVGRHATSALYNASEHRNIPGRWIWGPLAKVQEGLGGKARAIMLAVVASLLVIIAALVFVPYPLKMDAKGQLLPRDRRWVYSPWKEAQIREFLVAQGDPVVEGQRLALMHDFDLQTQVIDLQEEISGFDREIQAYGRQYDQAKQSNAKEEDLMKISLDQQTRRIQRDQRSEQLKALRERVHAHPDLPGFYWLLSPIEGSVLNASFHENFTHRTVKPYEQFLRVGNKKGPWEIELKIPQKHIGQILQAYKQPDNPQEELDVDVVLRSAPTKTYKAKLARRDIGGEATPNKDDNNESDPVVFAYVRIEGEGINPADAIPQSDNYRVTGTDVVAKVKCGNHALGYSLFYGVWEFLYEKVVFFF